MNDSKKLRAGVIGLGIIGGGVASSLVNRGRIPAVYDIVPDAYKKHAGVPPQVASAAEVAEASDVVMIATFTAEQAEEALTGDKGLLTKCYEELIVVLLSTVSVDEVKSLAALCMSRKAGFLDCGVTPGSLAAKNGLVAMVGGEKEVVERARPVLEDWSGSVIHCGPNGTGMAAKVARNVNTFSIWRIVAESTRLARAAGVDAATYLKILEEVDKVDNISYNLLRHCAKTPDGTLPENMREMYPKFMKKDLGASKSLSDFLGIKMPVRDAVIDLIDDTCNLV